MVVDHLEDHELSNSSGELHLDNLKKICEISSTVACWCLVYCLTKAKDNS